MKARLGLLSTLGMLAVFFAGCTVEETRAPASEESAAVTESAGGGQQAAAPAETEAMPAGKTWRLAFITNNAADFWTIARAGCTQAETDLGGIKMEFLIPGDGSAATQQRYVDDLLAKGVDGIAISPRDPANQTQMLNKAAGQALLVTQDSDAPESDRACYIGTDNAAAGRQAGELIKEALPEGGKIMVFVGTLDAQNAIERLQGIKEVLEGSNVEIIDVRTDDADPVRAKANPLDTIVKYPEVQCLVGLYSYNGPGILNAVKDSGKLGEIEIVCFDEDPQTLQGIKDGHIYATVVQQPYEFGYQAMKVMKQVLEGDAAVIPADKRIVVPTLKIKQDNVDEFWANLKKLTGKE